MTYHTGDILLNKYRIERLLGRGGFAEVYLATHLQLNAPRALKVLRKDAPGLGSSEYRDYDERFRLEAQLGAMFNHPNLVRVYDFEQADDTLILVMEYCPGGSLADLLQKEKRRGNHIPVNHVVQIGIDTSRGLGELHKRDVVHRDIKPSNILLDTQGSAKVSDLGLAQIPGGFSQRSRLGSMAPKHPGTPGYMSPEQEVETSYLKPPSDIFSLGLVLFEILTERNYLNLRPGALASEFRQDVPEWLDKIIRRMLLKEASGRPWDGQELERLLSNTSEKTPVLSRLMLSLLLFFISIGIISYWLVNKYSTKENGQVANLSEPVKTVMVTIEKEIPIPTNTRQDEVQPTSILVNIQTPRITQPVNTPIVTVTPVVPTQSSVIATPITIENYNRLQLLEILESSYEDLNSLSFSPNSQWLAVGTARGNVKIWNMSTNEFAQTLLGHTNDIDSLSFSPDNKLLASASIDQSVRIWQIPSGRLHQTLIGPPDYALSASFSPLGNRLAIGYGNNSIRIYNTDTWTEAVKILGHKDDVNAVAYSPDGKSIVSGSSNQLLFHKADTENLLWSKDFSPHRIEELVYSPDGSFIAALFASNSTLVNPYIGLIDAQNGSLIRKLSIDGWVSFVDISFSGLGDILSATTYNGDLLLWNVSDGTLLRVIPIGSESDYLFAEFSPDGTKMAVATGTDQLSVWGIRP